MLRRLALIALIALLSGTAPPATFAGHANATAKILAEPEAGAGALLALIAHARHGLEGEAAAIASRPLLAGLEAAARRHLPVRLIVAARPTTGVAHALAAAGVQIRMTDRRLGLAGGFLVADGATAWIGSMDWSDPGFTRLRGYIALVTGSAATQAGTVFAADWNRRPLRSNPGALLVSPVNARAAVMRLLLGARRAVDLITAVPPDRVMAAALATARRHGVRVRIGSTGAASGRVLPAAGMAMVIDGQVAAIGGQSLGAAGLDRSRALGVILRDRVAAAGLERILAGDLAGPESRTAPPAPSSTAVPTSTATATATATPALPPTATASATAPPPTATATIAPTPQGFAVILGITPSPVHNGQEAMITAYSTPGASCAVQVVYGSGASVPAFQGDAQVVPATGAVFWQWRVVSNSTSGLATATCTYQGATTLGRAVFIILL